MESTRSKIELQTIPIKSVDPKDQINAKAKVVKICDPRVKLFEREPGDVEASKSHPADCDNRKRARTKRRPRTWHVPPRTDVAQSICCG